MECSIKSVWVFSQEETQKDTLTMQKGSIWFFSQ